MFSLLRFLHRCRLSGVFKFVHPMAWIRAESWSSVSLFMKWTDPTGNSGVHVNEKGAAPTKASTSTSRYIHDDAFHSLWRSLSPFCFCGFNLPSRSIAGGAFITFWRPPEYSPIALSVQKRHQDSCRLARTRIWRLRSMQKFQMK